MPSGSARGWLRWWCLPDIGFCCGWRLRGVCEIVGSIYTLEGGFKSFNSAREFMGEVGGGT